MTPSVRFPKFATQLQHPPFANFGKSWTLANLKLLVPLFDLKSLGRTRRLQCRDFKSAALALPPCLAGFE